MGFDGTIQEITLSMHGDIQSAPCVEVQQADTASRKVRIHLRTFDGLKYTIPYTAKAALAVQKKDGTRVYDECEIEEESQILVTLSTQTIACTGKQRAQIYIYTSEGDIKTQPFYINVPRAVYSEDAIKSSDEYGILLEKKLEYEEALDSMLPLAESAQKNAESAAENAKIVEESMQKIGNKAIPNGFDYDEDYNLYLTSDGERIGDPVTIIAGSGGGGGSVSSSTVTLKATSSTSINAAVDDEVKISFDVTSLDDGAPTGDLTCEIYVNDIKKINKTIPQGSNTINVTSYLAAGDNKIKVKCTDVYGMFKILFYTVSMIDLRITSTFDSSQIYSDTIPYKYTAHGEVEKTIHILLDDTEVYNLTTSLTNRQTTVNLSPETHGVHTLDVYATATLNGQEIESEHLRYEILYVTESGKDILIASLCNVDKVKQGELVQITYSVYNPAALYNDVELSITCAGKTTTQTVNVGRDQQTWSVRNYPVGEVTFEITSGDVSKSHAITVSESDLDIEAVTNDLELYLTSAGRANNELDPATWTYGDVATSFSGVNWSTSGWITDDDGDTALRLMGGATAEIAFKPFESDLKSYGKTLEFEFAVRDVNKRDAVLIECMDGDIGIKFTADTATLKSQLSEISCKYCEDKKLRVTFVIESKSDYRMMQVYLNGVLSGATQYATSDIFKQDTPATIKIGSEYCTLDLYTIRSYTAPLTHIEAKDNYIADLQDIAAKTELVEANDIYNQYGVIQYSKVKDKIPVMTITGNLPQSKGDKQDVEILFEHNTDPSLSYEDTATVLDVQGTSSQWYIRKNYKGKTSAAHQHMSGQMPSKVFCTKADYAEATGTHNTQNANLIETLYDTKTPAQEADPRCRTTIAGYPIVIFHKAAEDSEPVFIGKYNYNFDKGSAEVFGFDGTYDVECWEFKDNTSAPCNFTDNVTTENWSNSFEARYPEDSADITRFKVMHDWVVSTKDDLNKFKTEFEDHFDLDRCLIYYVYTSLMLMVDQRAKNMFLTYWATTDKWEPWFYDNDTCLGINNEGRLVFDYYHEDIDQLDGANVYNGQNSVLWTNFRQAFADEIKTCYQNLRNKGKLTKEIIKDRFITQGSDKWSAAIYNEDADYKYVSMLRSDNNAGNLYQITGTGEHHLEYFIDGRIDYYDSKWYASDYANDYVSLRIYTPTEWSGVTPNADITVIPFSAMYAGVRYKANGELQQTRAMAGDTVLFEAPDETFNDTETAIYGASNLSSLGDLAPLYCGSIDVSKATRLTTLKIGDATEGYSNPNLTEVAVGANRLLKSIDVRNCPNLTSLDVSGCVNIQEIYATDSGITGVDLPVGGYVKVLHLPYTLKNLTIKDQLYIEDLTIADMDDMTTLNIENAPTVDVLDILDKATNLKYVRLVKMNWTFDTSEEMLHMILMNYGGLDDNGDPMETANISGTCHIKSLTGADYAKIKEAFPYMTITYDNLTSYVYTMAGDLTTILHTQEVANGGNAVSPLATGAISTPSKSSDAQYTYTYTNGWTTDKTQAINGTPDPNVWTKVEGDRYVYPVFKATLRSYDIKFYNRSTLLETVTTPYGSVPVYSGDTPVSSEGSADDYPFIGWGTSSSATSAIDLPTCTGTASYYAIFGNPYELAEIEDDWTAIMASIDDGSYKTKYAIGNYKPLNLGDEGVVNMQIVAKDLDELADNSGTAALTWIAMGLLTTSHGMNPTRAGDSGAYTEGTGTIGGWEKSEMRTHLKETIKPMIPSEVSSNIVEIKRSQPAYDTAGSKYTQETTDDVWIPAYDEVYSKTSPYKLCYPYSDDTRRIKKKPNGTATDWWLRSADYTSSFYSIVSSGYTSNYYANVTNGVALSFSTGISKS